LREELGGAADGDESGIEIGADALAAAGRFDERLVPDAEQFVHAKPAVVDWIAGAG
jgi:hypothetical protein